MVGSMYPFPLIEDGDFDIPSVFMTEEEGIRLAKRVGTVISLESHAQRIPAKGCNVIARKGPRLNRRLVFFAHIDAKLGTPGACDNASGVVVLLLLAELLARYSGNLGIELVALNGEDYYSNPGEQQYLALNAGRFDEIVLGINLDGLGYRKGGTAYSLYDCPPEIAGAIHSVFSCYKGIAEGERWYQGDHGLLLMNHRPALALTSEFATELMMEIVHTPKDNPEVIDPMKLVYVAFALRELLPRLIQLSA
jgi:aminopeptidase YwaD